MVWWILKDIWGSFDIITLAYLKKLRQDGKDLKIVETPTVGFEGMSNISVRNLKGYLSE